MQMTEREQFEAWWPSVGQTIGKAAAWEAWQAATALQDQRVRELEDALRGLLQLAGEDLRLDDIDLCKEMRDGLKALSATARES